MIIGNNEKCNGNEIKDDKEGKRRMEEEETNEK